MNHDHVITDFLADRVADPQTGWSLGTFGAIAEFTRDRDESVELTRQDGAFSAVTARGGLKLRPATDARLVASETATSASWNHRVAICLPQTACAMSRREVLTEVGPDTDALRLKDRGAALFDLGLSTLQVDLCIRTSDADTVQSLRACVGRSVFASGNPAIGLILNANPHRVFISRVGRIEVYQPIPAPNGKSPEGPHTHLLPKLLQHRRTHAATEPIPDGWIPCAHCYPPHPAKDGHGRPRPFDRSHQDAFQATLRAFGDPTLLAIKEQALVAIRDGRPPDSIAVSGGRHALGSVRVALRQLEASSARSPALQAWIAAYEPAKRQAARADETDEHDHDPHG
jgi:hypothetical protein